MDVTQGPNDPATLMKATPEQYVTAAFSKCTSGVHYAYLPHEIVGLLIENLKDIVPIDIPMKFFANMYRQKALEVKKGK